MAAKTNQLGPDGAIFPALLCFFVLMMCSLDYYKTSWESSVALNSYMSALGTNGSHGVMSIYATTLDGSTVEIAEFVLIDPKATDVSSIVRDFNQFTLHMGFTNTEEKICHGRGRGRRCKLVKTGIDVNHPNRMVFVGETNKLSPYMKPFFDKFASSMSRLKTPNSEKFPYVTNNKDTVEHKTTIKEVFLAINGKVILNRAY
jgi:hypothetical protein